VQKELLQGSTVITSAANESVKYVRALHRRRKRYQEQVFVGEGLRTIEDSITAGVQPAFLFHTLQALEQPRARAVVSRAEGLGASVRSVSDSVMEAMSDTVTPSGILGVFPMAVSAIPYPLKWVLVLDRLRDPGNAGTILRSALAAGVDAVITSKGTVDVYSPKVVRAAMGAHFRLTLCPDQPWRLIGAALQGLQVLVARPRDGVPYWEVDWQRPTALVIGGEAEGVGPEAEKVATGHVTIPMRDSAESLNAAVAAGVLLMEASRQQSSRGS